MKRKRKFTTKDLLKYFIKDEKVLTKDVISKTEEYLFKNGDIPFFIDKELFETVVMYLKDLMIRNQLKTLNDIFEYYEYKKQEIGKFIKNVMRKDK